MQFRREIWGRQCEIWGLNRRSSISFLPATDVIQNSLVTSLHSIFTHLIESTKTTSMEDVNKEYLKK